MVGVDYHLHADVLGSVRMTSEVIQMCVCLYALDCTGCIALPHTAKNAISTVDHEPYITCWLNPKGRISQPYP